MGCSRLAADERRHPAVGLPQAGGHRGEPPRFDRGGAAADRGAGRVRRRGRAPEAEFPLVTWCAEPASRARTQGHEVEARRHRGRRFPPGVVEHALPDQRPGDRRLLEHMIAGRVSGTPPSSGPNGAGLLDDPGEVGSGQHRARGEAQRHPLIPPRSVGVERRSGRAGGVPDTLPASRARAVGDRCCGSGHARRRPAGNRRPGGGAPRPHRPLSTSAAGRAGRPRTRGSASGARSAASTRSGSSTAACSARSKRGGSPR